MQVKPSGARIFNEYIFNNNATIRRQLVTFINGKLIKQFNMLVSKYPEILYCQNNLKIYRNIPKFLAINLLL